MEFFHLSKLVREYFDSFPEPMRGYLYQGLYWLGALSILYVIYRVSSSENVSESGRVSTIWYKPSTWFSRFQVIKEQNRQDTPAAIVSALDKARAGLQWAYAGGFILLGLIFLAIGVIAWSTSGWWLALLGLAFWLVSFLMIKSLRKK
jgi:Flp pilus assembly protein TadB